MAENRCKRCGELFVVSMEAAREAKREMDASYDEETSLEEAASVIEWCLPCMGVTTTNEEG